MEIAKSCEDGNSSSKKMPIGFRFYPTDEELVVHYLKRKVFSLPLPASDVIPDLLQLSQPNPLDLPGDMKEKRYFFCQRKMNSTTTRNCSLNSAECGYWKARIGKDKQILAPGTNLLIGIKKSFVFYEFCRKTGTDKKTQWVMHEFCLVGSITTPHLPQKVLVQVGDWIVCSVYQKIKRRAKKHRIDVDAQVATNMIKKCRTNEHVDLSIEGGDNNASYNRGSNSMSPCSSGITDDDNVYCNDLLEDHEEANSHNVV